MVADGEEDGGCVLFFPEEHDAEAVVDGETPAAGECAFEFMHAERRMSLWIFK